MEDFRDNMYEGCGAVIGLIIVVAIAWLVIVNLTDQSSPPGHCRTEPGYMGRQEIVECYER